MTRLGTGIAAAVAALTAVALTAAPAVAQPAPHAQLTDVAAGAALARAAADPAVATAAWADRRVTVFRSEGDHAVGAVVLVPQSKDGRPRDWLFTAERAADGAWRVALDGEAAFAEMAAASKAVTDEQRAVLTSHGSKAQTSANGDNRTGMRLPWAANTSWSMLGGPHAYDAGSGPWSSLDLAGGDQRVLAARAGLAYTVCTGLIRVVHDRGYSTRYYHLWDYGQFNGTSVAAGSFLGYTGTEVGCGGSANARHVHFSLMQNGAFVGIAGHAIGKWVFRNGGSQYSGSALHGSRVAYVGGLLQNYGALGFTQGIVDATGDASVNKRSGPGTGYPVVGSAADGSTISVACSANGTTHTGRWGTTSLWNRLTDGTWVSDAFVWTGIAGPLNGYC